MELEGLSERVDVALHALPSGLWSRDLEQLRNATTGLEFASSDRRALIESAESSLQKGRIGVTSNLICFGLVSDPVRFVASIQRSGILRPSRRASSREQGQRLISLVRECDSLFSELTVAYLNSLEALYSIAEWAQDDFSYVQTSLAKGGIATVRAALATVEVINLDATDWNQRLNPMLGSRELRFYNSVRLYDAVSTLLAHYRSLRKPDNELVRLLQAPSKIEGAADLLIAAAHIGELRNWEILVDRFGYRFQQVEPHVYRLVPPSLETERAIRLGYMKAETYSANTDSSEDAEDDSLERLAQEMMEAVGERLLRRDPEPYTRYVLELPTHPRLLELLSANHFFREERDFLKFLSDELSMDVESLLGLNINPDLTVLELIKGQRLFRLIHHCLCSSLPLHRDSNAADVLNSVVPVIHIEHLKSTLLPIVGVSAAAALLENLMSSSESNAYFDVYYRPLIRMKDVVLPAIGALATSNTVRNSLFHSMQRPKRNGDPISDAIREELKSNGWKAFSEIKYSFEDGNGEIDVIAFCDDFVLALECKNSLLPSSPHELLTSLDYVQYAAEQLSRLALAWGSMKFSEGLERRLKINSKGQRPLVTGIVMANRMFSGMRIEGHPVRDHRELLEFLSTGIIKTRKSEFSCWDANTLTPNDIRRFLCDDLTYQPIWDSMTEYAVEYRFKKGTLQLPSMSLDISAIDGNFRNRGFRVLAEAPNR